MQLKFIVSHEGLELGPFSEPEIRQMLGSSQLLPIDYLYDETKQDWVLINERFDLKADAHSPELTEAPPPQDQVVRRKDTSKFSLTNGSAGPTPAPAGNPTTLGLGTPLGAPVTANPQSAVVKVEPVQPVAVAVQPAPLPMSQPRPAAAQPVVSQPSSTMQTLAMDAGLVQFSGGVGTVSLKQLRAGRVVLKLKDCTSPDLALPSETVVNVEAGPAKMIGWELQSECRAGDDVVVHCWAKDAYDNTTTNFQGHLELVIRGGTSERQKVTFQNGVASVKVRWTKAEIIGLELADVNAINIGLPAPRTLAVKAGPATKLIVESPAQTIVGENLPVTVKAVDAFGNLATDFKGEIAVGVSLETPANKAS